MNSKLPFLMPLVAVASVAALMISLGLLFISLGQTGTIIAGLVIIVTVPAAGALLTRGKESAANH